MMAPKTAPERVLVVEDDDGLRTLLKEELEEAGLCVHDVASVEQARSLLGGLSPDVIITDQRLPGADGMELLRETRGPDAPGVILITAFGGVSQAVAAVKAGADDFLTKPLDFDRLVLCVDRVLETRRLRQRVRRYEELLDDEGFHGLYGESRATRALIEQIRQVARASGPVLVSGESGTGKELVARAIHNESDRAGGPFRAVNCAGIPEGLLESEFFGHAGGAFTGAAKPRKGLFAESEGGTLLLDEIGEMSVGLQATLLRVLQEHAVRPVGADREQPVDVRVIAATHADLEDRVRQGRFREDLFYRLETFTLYIPPLRDRADDVELLTARFLHRFSLQAGKDVRTIAPDALQRLRAYRFPGNVRELMNAVERAVAFCSGPVIGLADLPERVRNAPAGGGGGGPASSPGPSDEQLLGTGPLPTLAELEQRYTDYVLDSVGGNKRRAAALLGIGRRTLYRRLQRTSELTDADE